MLPFLQGYCDGKNCCKKSEISGCKALVLYSRIRQSAIMAIRGKKKKKMQSYVSDVGSVDWFLAIDACLS